MPTRLALLPIAIGSLSFSALLAQAPPPAPLPVSVAYHRASGTLLLVGGAAPGSAAVETWLWDGSGWRRHEGPGPSPRDEPLLASDPAGGRILLHGGERRDQPSATDTWEWDGTGWRRLGDSGPPPRSGAGMAYDERRQRLVVFGGSPGGGAAELNDLWEWDGRRWREVVPNGAPGSPPGRVLHGFAFDPGRGRVVLFGGARFVEGRPVVFDDTWEWDGVRWRRVEGPGPGGRDHVWMSYAPDLAAIVLHGGANPALGVLGDTWRYDGAGWVRIADGGPARARHRLAFDDRRGGLLLYGGWSPRIDTIPSRRNNDLWTFRGGRWVPIPPP